MAGKGKYQSETKTEGKPENHNEWKKDSSM